MITILHCKACGPSRELPGGSNSIGCNVTRGGRLCSGDAHVRVAAACVCCLGAALGSCGGLLERHLGRLVPPLLVRAADSKEAIRRAATDALAVLPGQTASPVVILCSSASNRLQGPCGGSLCWPQAA